MYTAEASSIHQFSGYKGLKEYFAAETDLESIIKKTEYNNLDILPAGAKKENNLNWILNEKVGDILVQLESRYDYILLDTPPVEPATDASILSKYADATIFVVRHHTTPSSIIQKIETTGKLHSFKEVALVFNGIKGRGFLKKYYGYKLGYGYETPIPAQYSNPY